MSAFICTNEHITALAYYAVKHLPSCKDIQEVGDALLMENVKSVNYRYNSTDQMEFKIVPQYQVDFSPVQIAKSASCLDYQSCEHATWESSDAYRIVQAIIAHTGANPDSPEYDKAAWGIPEIKAKTTPNKMDTDTVEIDSIVRESAKAYLVNRQGIEAWIPKLALRDDGTVTVKAWAKAVNWTDGVNAKREAKRR